MSASEDDFDNMSIEEARQCAKRFKNDVIARDDIIAAKDDIIAAKDEDQRAKSVVGVILPKSEFIPIVRCNGTEYTHINPRKVPPIIAFKPFVCHKISDMGNFDQLKMHEISSNFLESLTRTNKFSNEADLQSIVDRAVEDAVKICNKIIYVTASNSGIKQPFKLDSKKEAKIFTNVIDHVVVFDSLTETPVFAIETKKYLPVDSSSLDKMFGQCYDQLRELRAKGSPCPFGALTSCEHTYITWLDEPIYDEVIEEHESQGFNVDRLTSIIKRLPSSETSPCSPSPQKMIPSDESSDGSRIATSSPELIVTSQMSRSLNISNERFEQMKLVDVLVNGIFCSLYGSHRQVKLLEWNKGTKISVKDSIRMTKTQYQWYNLTVTHKEPFHLENKSWFQDFYLIDYLGYGATSKIYRAITPSGYSCVVKIYAERRSDDNTILPRKTFMNESNQKATKEVVNFRKIYGDLLKKYVWQQTLNNLHCVIMPFFEPIPKDKRIETLTAVKEILEKFAGKKMLYKKTDQYWRHVGTFQGKVYLFDLGDLDDVSSKSDDFINAEINKHVEFLMERAVDSSPPNVNSPTEVVV